MKREVNGHQKGRIDLGHNGPFNQDFVLTRIVHFLFGDHFDCENVVIVFELAETGQVDLGIAPYAYLLEKFEVINANFLLFIYLCKNFSVVAVVGSHLLNIVIFQTVVQALFLW